MILDIGKFPEGIFMATTHDGARFLWYFHCLFTLCPLRNSHEEALCLWEEFCSWKKSKAEEKKKKHPKKKERVLFCQEKKEIPLSKWLVLAELHAGVQILNKEVTIKPKLAISNVKNEYLVPALIWKH